MMEQQGQPQTCLMIVDLDQLVPQDHLLRRIKAKVDFTFIYEKVRPPYASKGRPSVDPVRLVKMMLIGYLYGITSERQLEQEIHLNLAYRWFLNLPLNERVPDHSTLSQNRHRRSPGRRSFRTSSTGSSSSVPPLVWWAGKRS